jgi:glycosyltransferase involved in cell wall biosynthesis
VPVGAPPAAAVVGYVPFAATQRSLESEWLSQQLGVRTRTVTLEPSWNEGGEHELPGRGKLTRACLPLLGLSSVVLEGPAGLLWAAVLRAQGFRGSVAILPYVNPRGWRDVLAAMVYAHFADPRDRVFVGSAPSAAVYAALGAPVVVGEPYGIDDELFRPRPGAEEVRADLDLPPGRLMLYAGRPQPDKDLHRLLRVGLKARVLFPDLSVVVATHLVDNDHLRAVRQVLAHEPGVRFVLDPPRRRLAALYTVADVFVTATTSGYETFGRAPAEALACGCPAVGPRYDGLAEVLDQVGGTAVHVDVPAACEEPPVVDEGALLRAVYDVLSCANPPVRAEIRHAADRRFARSRTIRQLRHLVDGSPPPPVRALDPVALEVPRAWRARLSAVDAATPEEALASCWATDQHEQLSRWDESFVTSVRRSLCPRGATTRPSPPAR